MLASLAKQKVDLETSTKTLTEALAKQTEVVGSLQAEHDAANQMLKRWQAEIQFVNQFKQNRAEFEKAEKAWQQQQEVLDELQQQASQATADANATTQQLATAQQQMKAQEVVVLDLAKSQEELTKQKTALDTTKKNQVEQQGKLTKGIAALAEAIKNADAALKLAGEDKPLSDAIAQLTGLREAKAKEAEQVTAAIKATDQQLQVNADMLTQNQTASAEAKTGLAKLQQQVKSAQEMATKTQATLTAIEAKVQEADAVVQELQGQIDTLEQQRMEMQQIEQGSKA